MLGVVLLMPATCQPVERLGPQLRIALTYAHLLTNRDCETKKDGVRTHHPTPPQSDSRACNGRRYAQPTPSAIDINGYALAKQACARAKLSLTHAFRARGPKLRATGRSLPKPPLGRPQTLNPG